MYKESTKEKILNMVEEFFLDINDGNQINVTVNNVTNIDRKKNIQDKVLQFIMIAQLILFLSILLVLSHYLNEIIFILSFSVYCFFCINVMRQYVGGFLKDNVVKNEIMRDIIAIPLMSIILINKSMYWFLKKIIIFSEEVTIEGVIHTINTNVFGEEFCLQNGKLNREDGRPAAITIKGKIFSFNGNVFHKQCRNFKTSKEKKTISITPSEVKEKIVILKLTHKLSKF